MTESKILRGRESICHYLGNMNKNTFYKWIRKGMPVYKDDNLEWVSHTRALDEFFYQLSISGSLSKKNVSSP